MIMYDYIYITSLQRHLKQIKFKNVLYIKESWKKKRFTKKQHNCSLIFIRNVSNLHIIMISGGPSDSDLKTNDSDLKTNDWKLSFAITEINIFKYIKII